LAEVKAWQSRPLAAVYAVVSLDALYVNIKVSGRISKRAVYLVLAITPEGNKELYFQALDTTHSRLEGGLGSFCYPTSRTLQFLI
jgi:transposase-like protein